ncbi:aminotransferase class I/II-fold pyridoxal phosphate-dependent enzyme [Gracilibacillus sp. YIM 98692]|uniref:aminotransferase class I/II-fold pyridoxal phosphate-dependent enzyme n=1 Tax=Gracilibacillus sp. YIM 98692 TaxID=2663532 RepID=UPI0013D80A3D|nr:aminotransferase class I/II-fold pyridoxal phosphate-dependent enzyme [Gracilibacillus sp. YIM 98692]
MNHLDTPLFDQLDQFARKQNVSFHVPGHKNGQIYTRKGYEYFSNIFKIDLTELTDLDDLHAAEGIIEQAQELASNWFHADRTYFLVNGSTAGNLTMILACCQPNDVVIVQRNCHKSILHGIELAGAKPVFIAPELDMELERYTQPSLSVVQKACQEYPEAKALILTYPDYYGKTYDIKSMIDIAHDNHIPVLVDEAHGCHLSLSFIKASSAVSQGADIVVQSAHKMTPALTMGAYLHVQTERVDKDLIQHYLQVLQSSSPSYPVMASLDLARCYLANYTQKQWGTLGNYLKQVRKAMSSNDYWQLEKQYHLDDPLKCTIKVNDCVDTKDIASLLESEGIFPELVTDWHILFVVGLEPTVKINKLIHVIEKVKGQLNNAANHAKIKRHKVTFLEEITTLALSYDEMKKLDRKWMEWEGTVGYIAAESIIPYPPGIPLIAKGEKITKQHLAQVFSLYEHGVKFQPNNRMEGLFVFSDQKK